MQRGWDCLAEFFDALMYLLVGYVQTSSFTPIDKQSAIKALDDQIDKLEMTDDAAQSLLTDLKVALDMIVQWLHFFR